MSSGARAPGDLLAGRLAGARRLDLRGAGLTALPAAVFDLADTLEELDISGNALDSLPPDLHRLRRLKILFASGNRFTALPPALGACPALEMVGFKSNAIAQVAAEALPTNLRWLILTDNAIDRLPDALGERPRLQKLMLAGNRLSALPARLRDAQALELLRLAANAFARLPDWLPALPRLNWLAWGGNPMTAAREAQALAGGAGRAIDPEQIDLGERLGEGASGVIHAARWRGDDGVREVAVKRFKGAVTSDGWAHSEMAASLAAGAHEGLIAVHGPLRQTPGADPALVLARVPAALQSLAAPPSFDTCTRDVYAPGWRLSADAARAIAARVAHAMAHLHACGLVHGDLYAHNLLSDGAGQVLLGDFGAASFLPPAQPELHAALRGLDVRAFGILLNELLVGVPSGHSAPELEAMHACAARCHNAAAQAPTFDELAERLR